MDGVGREPNDGEDDGEGGRGSNGGEGTDWVSRMIIGH